MIDEQILLQNKEEFITLIRSINRPNAKIEALIERLESTDFFYAPASANHHASYRGGLCEHSLNVYYNMMHLLKYKSASLGISEEDIENKYKESVIITALLHDISKMNLYVLSSKNVKVYSPDGDKRDILGTFYWDSQLSYIRRPAKERFIYGSHEMNSEYIVSKFIPLTIEESSTILHHMGGMSWDSAKDNLSEVFDKYPLSLLLHLADMMATYVDEGVLNESDY